MAAGEQYESTNIVEQHIPINIVTEVRVVDTKAIARLIEPNNTMLIPGLRSRLVSPNRARCTFVTTPSSMLRD